MALEIVEDHYTAGVATFSQASNYRLFSLMANVRNEGGIAPVSPPKGLPEGLAKGTEHYLESLEQDPKNKLHTHTWLTADEVKEVVSKMDTFCPGVVACNAAMQELVRKGSNPRLIVAFSE